MASGLQLAQLAAIFAAWPLMAATATGSCTWPASSGVKVSTALGTDFGRACMTTSTERVRHCQYSAIPLAASHALCPMPNMMLQIGWDEIVYVPGFRANGSSLSQPNPGSGKT